MPLNAPACTYCPSLQFEIFFEFLAYLGLVQIAAYHKRDLRTTSLDLSFLEDDIPRFVS